MKPTWDWRKEKESRILSNLSSLLNLGFSIPMHVLLVSRADLNSHIRSNLATGNGMLQTNDAVFVISLKSSSSKMQSLKKYSSNLVIWPCSNHWISKLLTVIKHRKIIWPIIASLQFSQNIIERHYAEAFKNAQVY